MIRRRLRLRGVVQGIGFRPHAYRLATELRLAGIVRNDESGVSLEVEGDEATVERFVERLVDELPPMGAVTSLDVEPLAPLGQESFAIARSEAGGPRVVGVTPDAHVCEACLAELRDPRDRRYRYPFVNCTRCGPRFTIVRDVPYDRKLTTMAAFPLCEACRREYEDPADRRFHAEPIACPACGPRLTLLAPGGEVVESEDPLEAARAALLRGAVVAVKGVGGFHLACLAGDQAAVRRLRERKGREGKPFAVMARDLEAARTIAVIDETEAALLESVPRPIVLVRKAAAGLAPAVAPGLETVGVMLPSSPLHVLLLDEPVPPLVMTSGNPSEEPIVTDNAEAVRTLSPLADLLLVHDREICTGCDDSVAQVAAGRPRLLRRSRGHVPRAIEVPGSPAAAPILAVGGELKGAICIARGRELVMGRHLGDLTNARALEAFHAEVDRLSRIVGVRPALVAHDLHPDYRTTRYALGLEGVERVAVQHHHAHLASCLADQGLPFDEPVVAAVLDGTGYGLDGTIWGGEVLVGDATGFRRAAHLRPVPLPGGDRAVRSPYRVALAHLLDALGEEALDLPLPLLRAHDRRHLEDLSRLLAAGLNAPASCGAGRLFDAAAGIAGIPSALAGEITYEAQAAMELEAAASDLEAEPYPLVFDGAALDTRVVVRAMVDEALAGAPPPRLAARFHATVTAFVVETTARVAREEGIGRVVLSGGCFGNRRLAAASEAGLRAAGLEVLGQERVPPGDGGLALGQALVARALARE